MKTDSYDPIEFKNEWHCNMCCVDNKQSIEDYKENVANCTYLQCGSVRYIL